MLKKTVTFTDYNGKNTTENLYFNLSPAELIKLEMSTMTISEDYESTTGGLQEYIQKAIDSREGKQIIAVFDLLVDASYGVRSEDGRLFSKDGVLPDFKASAAYSAFFMQLVTDATFGAEFIKGIMPEDLIAQAEKMKQEQKPMENPVAPLSVEDFGLKGEPWEPSEEEMLAAFEDPQPIKDYSNLTAAEFRALPKDEKLLAYKQKNAKK